MVPTVHDDPPSWSRSKIRCDEASCAVDIGLASEHELDFLDRGIQIPFVVEVARIARIGPLRSDRDKTLAGYVRDALCWF